MTSLLLITYLERIYATTKGQQKWLAGKQLRKIKKQIELINNNQKCLIQKKK